MLKHALITPWKVSNNLHKYMCYPLVRLIFQFNRIPWGMKWQFYGVPIVQKHRMSAMHFGDGLQLRSSVRSNPLGPNHPVLLCTWQEGARLEIGNDFAMSGGVLCTAEAIIIGNNVAVGANTTIIDTDFHPLDQTLRKVNKAQGDTKPILISDNVFIGMSCLILKGVTIGEASVIGAGSVVARDIPSGVMAAGNPAKIIRELP